MSRSEVKSYRATTRNWSICLLVSGHSGSHSFSSNLDWSLSSASPAGSTETTAHAGQQRRRRWEIIWSFPRHHNHHYINLCDYHNNFYNNNINSEHNSQVKIYFYCIFKQHGVDQSALQTRKGKKTRSTRQTTNAIILKCPRTKGRYPTEDSDSVQTLSSTASKECFQSANLEPKFSNEHDVDILQKTNKKDFYPQVSYFGILT